MVSSSHTYTHINPNTSFLVNGDGLIDLVVGGSGGRLDFYRNNGSYFLFSNATIEDNPFDGLGLNSWAKPALADGIPHLDLHLYQYDPD